MPDPEEVRLSILSGQIPMYWHVINGSASLAVRNVWVRGFLPPCIGLLLGEAVSAWIPPLSPKGPNWSFAFIYISIMLLIGLVFSFIAASMAKRSVMAFLPEGCLQFGEIESNLPNTQKILWYASIADIELRSNFLTGPYLVMRNRDGKKQKWYPHPWYGPCARTVQQFLTAYITYYAHEISQSGSVINAKDGNLA